MHSSSRLVLTVSLDSNAIQTSGTNPQPCPFKIRDQSTSGNTGHDTEAALVRHPRQTGESMHRLIFSNAQNTFSLLLNLQISPLRGYGRTSLSSSVIDAMSTERLTKRRRLDQAWDLPNPDPNTIRYLPIIDNALPEANTRDSVESNDTQPQKDPPVCLCYQLDLWPMFVQDTLEISAGRLSNYTNHSCPFTDLVQEALRPSFCGSSWVDDLGVSERNAAPDLLLKSRGWIFSQLPCKSNDYQRVSHYPRIILAINKRPPGVEAAQARRKLLDSVGTPYIIAELELVDKPEDQESWIHQGLPPPLHRPVERYFEFTQARQWLDRCEERHKDCKKDGKLLRDAFFWRGPGFRLIDVRRRCLTQQKKPCEYVALSYVWGKPAQAFLCTEKSNVDALGIAGALNLNDPLKHEGQNLPRTIVDAMHLVQRIGHQFLWIDALCIIQDDPEEKQRLIHGMDRVYEHANLTIICATGVDADAGLHGISPRNKLSYETSFTFHRKDFTSCLFSPSKGWISLGRYNVAMCRPSLVDKVRKCHWNTRGWTCQEHYLSERCIYFTADEVFFSCKQFQWREGYALDRFSSPHTFRTGPPWWSTQIIYDTDPSPHLCLIDITNNLEFEKYQLVVQEHCQRKLDYPQDILNAFQAIFNRVCGASDDSLAGHAQGIRPRFLLQALLWYPLEGTTKRKCDLESCGSKEEFSSWSWASWSGPVDFVYITDSLDKSWYDLGSIWPETIVSLVVEWHFLPSVSSTWSHAQIPGEAEMKILRKAFRSDFETIETPRNNSMPVTELPKGVLEFCAPVLLSRV
jgi:hypothetical protein